MRERSETGAVCQNDGKPINFKHLPPSVAGCFSVELTLTVCSNGTVYVNRTHSREECLHLAFKEERVTQAAAELLRLRGGRMSYLKLMKLLYLVDRESLLRFGRPVSYDTHVCMKHGPVLSSTLNLIREEPDPTAEKTYWGTWISGPKDWDVELIAGRVPDLDQLSAAEVELIREIFGEYGHKGRWELKEITHKLPEYHDPGGTSTRIHLKTLLVGGGKSEEEAKEILDALLVEKDAEASFS